MGILENSGAQAIIFYKDGTLIDFDAMWGSWTLELADRLETVTGLQAREALCSAFGYDLGRGKVSSNGKLAANPMEELYDLTIEVAHSLGLSYEEAELAVSEAWLIPDPVALAKPLTDLSALFTRIADMGIKIAIATNDDRKPTEATLERFDVEHFVQTMICADDGLKQKPAPEVVTIICERLNVLPAKAIVVGDTLTDLKMANAAHALLSIGVLSGVSSRETLESYADAIIQSVDEL